jgi:hypothetical protein
MRVYLYFLDLQSKQVVYTAKEKCKIFILQCYIDWYFLIENVVKIDKCRSTQVKFTLENAKTPFFC